MSGHFVNQGKPFSIPSRPKTNERGVQIVLPPGLAAKYVVEKKEIPANLPNQWKDNTGKTYSLEWINNFGLKEAGKPNFVQGPVSEDYELLLDKEPGKKLFYFDNGVKPFEQGDLLEPKDQANKIAARLRLGDPPIGWGI